MIIRLVVNGTQTTIDAAPAARLADVLRNHLGLTGTKEACSRGDCGACTVLVGDRAVPSCLVLAARVDEPVRTVEGIAADASALREAFADWGGLQCGYCTPGLVVRAYQLIASGECDTSDPRRRPAGSGRELLPLHRLQRRDGRGAARRRQSRPTGRGLRGGEP